MYVFYDFKDFPPSIQLLHILDELLQKILFVYEDCLGRNCATFQVVSFLAACLSFHFILMGCSDVMMIKCSQDKFGFILSFLQGFPLHFLFLW